MTFSNKKQRLKTPERAYELLKSPRKGSGPKITWKLTEGAVEAWKERIQTIIRHKDDYQLRQAIESLRRTCGFHESRKQAFQLFRLIKNEWIRARKKFFPYPDIFIGFVGKRKKPTFR